MRSSMSRQLPAAPIAFLSALVATVGLPPSGGALGAQDSDAVVAPALYAPMQWRSIGPFRGGRSGGGDRSRRTGQRVLLRRCGRRGVWKTTDAGVTWNNVSDGFLQTASVGALAVAPSDPNVVYVGMGEHAPRGVTTSHGDGVYRSTDAGQTWVHLGLGPPAPSPGSSYILRTPTSSTSRRRVHPTVRVRSGASTGPATAEPHGIGCCS